MHVTAVREKGKNSIYWKDTKRYGQPKILAKFDRDNCQVCPSKTLCTRSRSGHRELTFSTQEEYLALHTVRQFQQTSEFKERYTKRAGIEGTISQAAYALNMRKARYRGLAKNHLQHVLTACAINLKRVADWISGKPRAVSRRRRLLFAQTRKSRFAALAA